MWTQTPKPFRESSKYVFSEPLKLRVFKKDLLIFMISVLKELGYRVNFKVLRAQYLDVPQKRERLIIEAIRNDLDIPFIFPKEKNYTVSLREALKDCPPSEGQEYPKRKKEFLAMVPEGGFWRDLPLEIQKEYMRGSFYLGGGKTGMA